MDRSVGTALSRAARTRPRLVVALGALGVSTSGVFVDLSGTSPGTATLFRCVLALPLLWPLARHERRRTGGLSRRRGAVAAVAGALFAGDALFWTQAVSEVGAGLTAMLVNTQVVIVPLLFLLIDRERPRGVFLAAVPFMVAGVVLTGGIVGTGAHGAAPVRGTVHAVLAALCYSGFLFLLRRSGNTGGAIQSYCGVLVSAAVISIAVGALWQGVTFAPGWPALGWLALTAVCIQVLGWLLVALATSHLSSAVSSALLMLTPVGALALAAVALGQQPTVLQLLGCALILVSAYAASVPGSFWRRPMIAARRSPGSGIRSASRTDPANRDVH
ncbi:drug/metabolite transporter (DMT)-like permease [Haloactinospora alba]|uniref:Drug/metabolite transporter (DMT)-like permease n=1 Tax=Haloactinospora alba TaxID=405555 RepID=A0A543N7K1_9ACTN|nr:DMT family transporter [Haloactinospora alba]TQN27802.1 drug/metabolite transporter (DMT)-like permease [Haloactinospora alba]